jgi:hypothetical protein
MQSPGEAKVSSGRCVHDIQLLSSRRIGEVAYAYHCPSSSQHYRAAECQLALRFRGRLVEENELSSPEMRRLCQAVSPNDEPCDYLATVHCTRCDTIRKTPERPKKPSE